MRAQPPLSEPILAIGATFEALAVGEQPNGKEDEKESGSPLLYLSSIFNSRIGIDHSFYHLTKILLWIFIIHLSFLFPVGPYPPIDWPYHFQLGLEISSGIDGGDHRFRGTDRIHPTGLFYSG